MVRLAGRVAYNSRAPGGTERLTASGLSVTRWTSSGVEVGFGASKGTVPTARFYVKVQLGGGASPESISTAIRVNASARPK